MDKTLHDLGGILLSGLPTFFLVLILAFFVKTLYVAPLKKVLAERHRLTEGAKKAAEDSFRNAESKVAEYEEALNRARNEIYQEQAEFLRQVHAEHAEQIRAVRAASDLRVAAAREALAAEAADARRNLEAQTEALARQIADSILRAEVGVG